MQKSRSRYFGLTAQIFYAMLLGVAFGHFFPETGQQLKALADGFIRLIKMIIAPLIFLTIVTGIAGMGDLKKVGKVGAKAVLYFEIVTTLALILGMLAVNVLKPGAGFSLESTPHADISKYTATTQKHDSFVDFMLHILPDSFVGAFATGNLLQVLVIAVLFGVAIGKTGSASEPLMDLMDRVSRVFFVIIHMIMVIAPLGAFGAMAFAIGKYGLESLIPLGKLIAVTILTLVVFVFGVLGSIAAMFKFSLWKLIRIIRHELVIVLGMGSSEPVMPNLMEKLQAVGCARPIVGLVLPTGYSFNLDGTSIYLAICVMFIAQAYGIDLSIMDQLTVLGIMMLTSKGAAAVAGAGFIVLAATVQATNILPVEGLALLLGIDRLMSSARAVTNVIGNTVATVVIAKLENEFEDRDGMITERVA